MWSASGTRKYDEAALNRSLEVIRMFGISPSPIRFDYKRTLPPHPNSSSSTIISTQKILSKFFKPSPITPGGGFKYEHSIWGTPIALWGLVSSLEDTIHQAYTGQPCLSNVYRPFQLRRRINEEKVLVENLVRQPSDPHETMIANFPQLLRWKNIYEWMKDPSSGALIHWNLQTKT